MSRGSLFVGRSSERLPRPPANAGRDDSMDPSADDLAALEAAYWRRFPSRATDECAALLAWLDVQRRAVVRCVDDLSHDQGRARPFDGANSLIGIINHLAQVECRWI